MSRRDDEQCAWEVQQAHNREHQGRHALVRDVTAEAHQCATNAGYSADDAAILSIAIGKLAGRTGGRHA